MTSQKLKKRRKVWVEFDEDGTPSWVTDNKGDILEGAKRFRFVELNSGDMILSREQVKALRRLAMVKSHVNDPIEWKIIPAQASCTTCHGSGTIKMYSGHNGDEFEDYCGCTRKISLTVSQALTPFMDD